MKQLLILDAGHGGRDAQGRYTTPPKKGKRYKWPQPTPEMIPYMWTDYWCEGIYNRAVAKALVELTRKMDAPFDLVRVYQDAQDTSLRTRIAIANKVHTMYDRSLFLSIHANSSPKHNAGGMEVLYHKGSSPSKKFAENVNRFCGPRAKDFGLNLRGLKPRSNGVYALHNSKMPAALIEVGFFDYKHDVEIISRPEFIHAMAEGLLEGVLEMFAAYSRTWLVSIRS